MLDRSSSWDFWISTSFCKTGNITAYHCMFHHFFASADLFSSPLFCCPVLSRHLEFHGQTLKPLKPIKWWEFQWFMDDFWSYCFLLKKRRITTCLLPTTPSILLSFCILRPSLSTHPPALGFHLYQIGQKLCMNACSCKATATKKNTTCPGQQPPKIASMLGVVPSRIQRRSPMDHPTRGDFFKAFFVHNTIEEIAHTTWIKLWLP